MLFIALWSQEYDKAVGESGDKVKLATQIHDLVRQNIHLCMYMCKYIHENNNYVCYSMWFLYIVV